MRENSREPQPVRLPNPTAESFVASLKVVHFSAILFFWLVLVALLLHLAAFVVFHAGVYDAHLGLSGVSAVPAAVGEETVPAEGGSAERSEAAAPAERHKASWWTRARADLSMRYAERLMATMRLVGLLASMLLLVTLFVYLEISLLGRLAGVRYLTVAFFLVLFLVATVYSWEPLLPGTRILGSLYVFQDFVQSYKDLSHRSGSLSLGEQAFHYGRFLVLPVFSLVLLIVSWLRFRKGYEESVLMNE